MSTPAAQPAAATQQHATVVLLKELLVREMCRRFQLTESDAAAWADALLDALRESVGGDRIGTGGLYLPVPNRRAARNQRIRDAMGPPPHSRAKVKQLAAKEHCSERTVWSILGRAQ